MSVYTISNPTALATKLVFDSAADGSNDADGDNVTSATGGNLYMIQIDNTENKAAVYLKLVDASSATPGSTTPNFVFYTPGARTATYSMPPGHAYSSGVSIWCTTTLSNSGSQSDPANAVEVRIMAS
jgi:hypothetical protein